MGSWKGMTNGLTSNNWIEGKDRTDDVPHMENMDVVMEAMNTNDPKMSDMSSVMETPPQLSSDEGMGCDIINEPLLLDTIIR